MTHGGQSIGDKADLLGYKGIGNGCWNKKLN